jgi:hypothetical protein
MFYKLLSYIIKHPKAYKKNMNNDTTIKKLLCNGIEPIMLPNVLKMKNMETPSCELGVIWAYFLNGPAPVNGVGTFVISLSYENELWGSLTELNSWSWTFHSLSISQIIYL